MLNWFKKIFRRKKTTGLDQRLSQDASKDFDSFYHDTCYVPTIPEKDFLNFSTALTWGIYLVSQQPKDAVLSEMGKNLLQTEYPNPKAYMSALNEAASNLISGSPYQAVAQEYLPINTTVAAVLIQCPQDGIERKQAQDFIYLKLKAEILTQHHNIHKKREQSKELCQHFLNELHTVHADIAQRYHLRKQTITLSLHNPTKRNRFAKFFSFLTVKPNNSKVNNYISFDKQIAAINNTIEKFKKKLPYSTEEEKVSINRILAANYQTMFLLYEKQLLHSSESNPNVIAGIQEKFDRAKRKTIFYRKEEKLSVKETEQKILRSTSARDISLPEAGAEIKHRLTRAC